MSKKHRHPKPINTPIGIVNATPTSEPTLTEEEMEAAIDEACMDHAERVPTHRQCKVCWGTNRGVGVCRGTKRGPSGAKRNYKCIKSAISGNVGCGHCWVEKIKHHQITIEWQEIVLNTRTVQ